MMRLASSYIPHQPQWLLLATRLANAAPGSVAAAFAGAAFCHLTPAEQLRCRAEIHAIKTAKRGGMLAQVTP